VDTRRGRAGGTYVLDSVRRRPVRTEDPERRSDRRIQDALDFRRVVEPGAAALAASRTLDASDRLQLTDSLAAVEGSTSDAHRRVADSRLHLAVALVAGSDSLTAAVADVQVRLGELLGGIPVLRRNIEHSDAQHRAVVDAILAGDPVRARSAMEEHCDATAALLRGLLA